MSGLLFKWSGRRKFHALEGFCSAGMEKCEYSPECGSLASNSSKYSCRTVDLFVSAILCLKKNLIDVELVEKVYRC